ncbi:MAG: FHA domain-containing protein [Armatimonadetes bacterium]|nr:FHA domain-containing protein [Armatimonadota bacterium]
MILKRWAVNLIGMLLGGLVGLGAVLLAGDRVVIPPLAAIVVALLFMALGFLFGAILGAQLFPFTPETSIRPEIPRQPWAWLRPRGDGLRSGFPLNRDQIVIGREVSCDVMLNNGSVSRMHSEIVRLAEGYLLRDMGSRNGTFVNGQRVQEVLLEDGDTLSIGDIELTFEGPRQPVRSRSDTDFTSLGTISSAGSVSVGLEQTAVLPTADEDEEDTEVWRPRPDR